MVDLNEFPSIFQKSAVFSIQTSENNLTPPYNQFERHIKVQWNMATRGSYVHNSTVEFSGASRKYYAIFSENWWFQTKRFTALLELVQLYKQNPLEKRFHFHHLPKLYIGIKNWWFLIIINIITNIKLSSSSFV